MGLAFTFYSGAVEACVVALIMKDIDFEKRATILSFDSLVGSSGSVLGQVGLGRVSKFYGIPLGYLISGFVMIFTLPPLMLLRKSKDKEDMLEQNTPTDSTLDA